MRFEVRALTTDNAVTTVQVEAADAASARSTVQQQSLRPISVRTRTGRTSRGSSFSLALFSQELLALLQAGLSLIEALESLQERSAKGETRDVISTITTALREGQRFSQALAAQPAHFSPLYVGIVQAAETTSELPSALARYVELDQRASQMRSKVVSAAVYPIVLLAVGSAVTLFLVGYVVPRFALVYEESGREMSFLTTALLNWGRLISSNGHYFLVVGLALFVATLAAKNVLRVRVSPMALLHRVPGLSQRVHQFELSRLYMTLGLLLSGGIPLVRSMPMVEATVSPATATKVRQASRRIAAGESFSSALHAEALTTPVALRLFRVGERAGTLADMLQRSARFHDAEVNHFIERFSRAAEPIMMTMIGVVVGIIVVLLYMPIFELAGSLQ